VSTFNLKDTLVEPAKSEEAKVYVDVVKASRLSELDLDSELLATYKEAKNLLEVIRYDTEIPPGQKVQAINSCNSVLNRVIEMQERLFNVESLKAMENALVAALQSYPDMKEKFLSDYKVALGELR